MKRRVEKKRTSRYARSFRRRYVRTCGDHRRWWAEAILQKKALLLGSTPPFINVVMIDRSLDARVAEVLLPKAKLIGGVS